MHSYLSPGGPSCWFYFCICVTCLQEENTTVISKCLHYLFVVVIYTILWVRRVICANMYIRASWWCKLYNKNIIQQNILALSTLLNVFLVCKDMLFLLLFTSQSKEVLSLHRQNVLQTHLSMCCKMTQFRSTIVRLDSTFWFLIHFNCTVTFL